MSNDVAALRRFEASEADRPVDDRGGTAEATRAIMAMLPDKAVLRVTGGADLEDVVWELMQEKCMLWWKLHDLLKFSQEWAPRGGWASDRKRRAISRKG